VLKGTVPDDYHVHDKRSDLELEESRRYLQIQVFLKKRNTVLLVVHQGLRLEDASISQVKSYYTTIVHHRLRPILVVTFMDSVNKRLGNSWNEFHALLGIGKKDIFLVDNTDAEHITFNRDITMLSIFDLCQRNVGDFINTKYINLPQTYRFRPAENPLDFPPEEARNESDSI
jgi:hypothetical protein